MIKSGSAAIKIVPRNRIAFTRFQSSLQNNVDNTTIDPQIEMKASFIERLNFFENEFVSNKEPIFPTTKDISINDLVSNSNKNFRHYSVKRSINGNLPVYSEKINGGSKIITEIRKINGNINQFKLELQEQLPNIPKDKWVIKQQSNKLIIYADVVDIVKNILSKKF
ncbi:hypothetical protein Kpol_325p3 [Vanderwaltozyma polyspora DSM 70294]|uniref:Large ribosomal subunit protein mL49 n=1 Tax=Vanderwaltozyma polyspora (strain ATCC 22028 / DSM 70294 / BCRC 21397 / CBS 2163 / NBRC 10782 / NRRL Y-8283 / UCD 57-17) TaxID=436907 RepID=A7TST6_VANPO|nr:uncharacterized protein Kpol_325p3 [Vanderwaltozyma polyspora DSM 70294]EDO14664.1 hypothetical protein Kpol_325p3 [Vanderwaltozyma polyspora DSM 70294]